MNCVQLYFIYAAAKISAAKRGVLNNYMHICAFRSCIIQILYIGIAHYPLELKLFDMIAEWGIEWLSVIIHSL